MFFFEPSNSKDAQSFSPPKSIKHAGKERDRNRQNRRR
jgi:hypothetical protein